jgi:kynureninase
MTAASLRALHEQAQALDAADPLAALRSRFALPRDAQGQPLTYLCGHSLGLMPLDARRLIEEELQDWADLGVEGHHRARRPWIDYAELLQQGLARLAGAQPDEVVAMNSLTVNLHLMMASFYRPAGRRRLIVMESGAFSSDRHAVTSQLAWHGLTVDEGLIEIAAPQGQDVIGTDALQALLAQRGDEVALVLWPGVQYRTGEAFDLSLIAAAARAAGACCGFDLAHAMGNLPLALHDSGTDFAVWCGYKYLNGGPGALAGAFVHQRHAQADLPRLSGWWGHDPATRFAMGPQFVPAVGAAGWQISNPPILSATPLLASLPLFEAAGTAALQAKTRSLGALLSDATATHCADTLQVITPAARGCQLSLRVKAGRDTGRRVFAQLTGAGVVADWREPDIIRVAPVPLYNTHVDVARLVTALVAALQS